MKRKALLLLPLSTLALVGCSKISIVDSSDNALFSYTLKQSCNQIIFSHSGLALNSTYRIVNGSTQVASITMSSSLTTSGTSSGGGPGGGWH